MSSSCADSARWARPTGRALPYPVVAQAWRSNWERVRAGRRRGIAVGNVLPRCSRAQHPQDPVQHFAGMPSWATATVRPRVRLRYERFE